MSIISKLFGKSPFEPLYQHMLKVKACVDLVRPLMDAFLKGDAVKVRDVARKIFKAEHDADIVKKNIRSSLPKSIFLPVARGDILRFLKEQDNIADSAEDLAALLMLRKTTVPDEIKEELRLLGEKGESYNQIIKRLIKMAAIKKMDERWNKILENDEFIPLDEL